MADFAAAQARILQRRAAREASLNAAAQSSRNLTSTNDSLPPSNRLSRLPTPLRSLLTSTSSSTRTLFNLVSSPYGTNPAFRVGQVDAELLDEALLDLLKKQAGEGLKLFGPHLVDDWEAEVLLLLRIVLWKLSIWDHGTSYGASLQGLKYIDARGGGKVGAALTAAGKEASRVQRAGHGLVMVLGRYGWTRWEEYLSAQEGGYEMPSALIRRLSRLSGLLTSGYNVAALASFAVFLCNGHYRTLTDRILRLRLVPVSNQTSREVSFEFLNRQLVWHAFTEFLLFLLPLVGITRWKRWLARAWKKFSTLPIFRLRRAGSKLHPNLDGDDDDATPRPAGELSFLPERTCAICHQDQNPTSGVSEQEILASSGSGGIAGSASTDITNPYAADPCGCIYCFVCLAQRIEGEEGEGWTCLRCGETVGACAPWDGDVLTAAAAASSRPGSSGGGGGAGRGSMSPASPRGSRAGTHPRGAAGEDEDERRSERSAHSHAPPRRRKSVMFDLDDDDSESLKRTLSARSSDGGGSGSQLSRVDPMPMDDDGDAAMMMGGWSRADEDDEAIESGDDEYD
jgi:peroxin-2